MPYTGQKKFNSRLVASIVFVLLFLADLIAVGQNRRNLIADMDLRCPDLVATFRYSEYVGGELPDA